MKDLDYRFNDAAYQKTIKIIQDSVKAIEEFLHIDDPFIKFTAEGGLAVKYYNKTGARSIKGTLVEIETSLDNSITTVAADAYDCIGAIYEDNVPDGSYVWVVVAGTAEVLLKDSTASTRGNWVKVSDATGRADATSGVPSPPTAAEHFKEIGHCLETQTAGTDVLCKINMHFL